MKLIPIFFGMVVVVHLTSCPACFQVYPNIGAILINKSLGTLELFSSKIFGEAPRSHWFILPSIFWFCQSITNIGVLQKFTEFSRKLYYLMKWGPSCYSTVISLFKHPLCIRCLLYVYFSAHNCPKHLLCFSPLWVPLSSCTFSFDSGSYLLLNWQNKEETIWDKFLVHCKGSLYLFLSLPISDKLNFLSLNHPCALSPLCFLPCGCYNFENKCFLP